MISEKSERLILDIHVIGYETPCRCQEQGHCHEYEDEFNAFSQHNISFLFMALLQSGWRRGGKGSGYAQYVLNLAFNNE
jgi:hypothetical protein